MAAACAADKHNSHSGLIYVLISPEYAQGIYHDLLGIAMLPLAFGLYGILAWFMSNLFIESEQKTPDIIIARTRTTNKDERYIQND